MFVPFLPRRVRAVCGLHSAFLLFLWSAVPAAIAATPERHAQPTASQNRLLETTPTHPSGIRYGGTSGVTLDEAIGLAVGRAPMLDARRAQVEAAEQESRRAGALPDPELSVGIDNLPVTGSDAFDFEADEMTMRRIGVRQVGPASIKHLHASESQW